MKCPVEWSVKKENLRYVTKELVGGAQHRKKPETEWLDWLEESQENKRPGKPREDHFLEKSR